MTRKIIMRRSASFVEFPNFETKQGSLNAMSVIKLNVHFSIFYFRESEFFKENLPTRGNFLGLIFLEKHL